MKIWPFNWNTSLGKVLSLLAALASSCTTLLSSALFQGLLLTILRLTFILVRSHPLHFFMPTSILSYQYSHFIFSRKLSKGLLLSPLENSNDRVYAKPWVQSSTYKRNKQRRGKSFLSSPKNQGKTSYCLTPIANAILNLLR